MTLRRALGWRALARNSRLEGQRACQRIDFLLGVLQDAGEHVFADHHVERRDFPRICEFEDIKAVKIGDEVDVLIEKLEDKEGMVVLSKEKAEFKKNWDKILTICNEGGTITGKVKAAVKGGLLVNIGVEAFLPASQIDIIPPKNLAQFIGNTYEFKVVKINQERQNIVLSRRELIEQQRNEKRASCSRK